MSSEAKWRLTQWSERGADGIVPLRRSKEHEKPTPAGPQEFATLGSRINCGLVGLVDEGAGYPVDDLSLGLPRLVEHRPKRIEASGTKLRKRACGQANQLSRGVGLRAGVRYVGGLLS